MEGMARERIGGFSPGKRLTGAVYTDPFDQQAILLAHRVRDRKFRDQPACACGLNAARHWSSSHSPITADLSDRLDPTFQAERRREMVWFGQLGRTTSVPTPVVLDCDTGTDDAVAIMLAALNPELDLLGVTTVAGNVPVDVVAENSLRVLQSIGRPRVPVFVGSATPLVRQDVATRLQTGSTFGMHGLYLDLPSSSVMPQAATAVDFLIDLSRDARVRGTGFTLVATAPLTNIARCVDKDPEFAGGVERLVIMGGGHAIGNVTPSAEFNFWADPEAAQSIVTHPFSSVTLVPLDATHAALLDLDDCQALRDLGTIAAIATANLVEHRIRAHDRSQPMTEAGSAPVHDALCIAALIEPDVLHVGQHHVDVEVDGKLTVGRSVIDVHRRSGFDKTITVAMGADARAFVQVLLDTFAPTPPSSAPRP